MQSEIESRKISLQTKRFVVPLCSLCNKEMDFVEGDTIYGDKWYHSLCWKTITLVKGNTKTDELFCK